MSQDYLERILKARVYDVAIETPLETMPRLSARLGHTVLLKREDLQPVFSFKIRGAYNKMVHLPEAQREKGVICASAGNHAQGVALSAQALGCRAVIVMPATTPEIKIQAVQDLGAEIILHGDTYSEAADRALAVAAEQGLAFVHPYDDPDVIAGQGTIGMEMLRQSAQPMDAVFVAVGGGGLIAGIAAYLKRMHPETRIIGVEPEDAAAMHASLAAGKRVDLEEVGLFADGVAVKQVGEETFRLCRDLVDEVVLVNTDEICAAIKDAYEDTRVILEPAGALSLAGMKAWVERDKPPAGRVLAAIACGANMNFDRLRHVSERAELGEQREAIVAVTIPERPGSFKAFCAELGDRNVTEFNYRYARPEAAHVFVGLQIVDREEVNALLQKLTDQGLQSLDLSQNEMAKLHIRHMVGGRAAGIRDEVLYRFEFPERPGALARFLNGMTHDWNITLFHYRNHGTDVGRVLIGLQVPDQEKADFQQFLDALGYPYVDETGNPAYRLFL